MSRSARLLATLAAVAAVTLPPTNAHAVNTIAFTWAVDCADENGASTGDLNVTLASGTYAVTFAGACSYGMNNQTIPLSTCGVLASPCVDLGGTATVPTAACLVSVGAATAGTCYTGLNGCGGGAMEVGGVCLPLQGGLVVHGGGSMGARMIDGSGAYGDNAGAFVVTAVMTPL